MIVNPDVEDIYTKTQNQRKHSEKLQKKKNNLQKTKRTLKTEI